MTLSRSRILYIGAMLASGLVIGLIVAARPEWQHTFFPAVGWPIGVSLVLELLIGQAVARGKAEPITVGDRFAGVLGAGLIITVILAFQG